MTTNRPNKDELAAAMGVIRAVGERGTRASLACKRLAEHLDTGVEYDRLAADYLWAKRIALGTFKPGDRVRILRAHFAGNPHHDAMVGLTGRVVKTIKSRAAVDLALDNGGTWEADPINLAHEPAKSAEQEGRV